MIIECISGLKIDPRVLQAIKDAPKNLTSSELLEQRVSFAFGSMRSDSGITKEQVRKVVLAQGGATADSK